MNKHLERLQRMHLKLSQSKTGVSRKELTLHIFNAPEGLSMEEEIVFCKAKRTEFFKLLNALRTGNYQINKKTVKLDGEGCTINYNPDNDSYCYALNSEKPKFNHLDGDEIMALPILLGVLLNYHHISIFDKFYFELTEKYAITEDDYVNNNIAITAAIKDFKGDDVVEEVVALHNSINENKKVTFSYMPVRSFNNELTIHVYPIQILFHEGLFYLWGVDDLKTKEIRYFRIDRITSEIGFATDDKFNSIKHRKSLNIENTLKHIVGVVPPESNKKPVKFKLKFYDWAVAYVLNAPIHHSWKEEEINNEDNSVTGTINVYDTFEVAFLLGRFRDYCEILEPKSYEPDLRKNKKPTRF